eukprot:COSAG01_NODE_3914_length_5542_cov_47.046298_7_plen_35_part_00
MLVTMVDEFSAQTWTGAGRGEAVHMGGARWGADL